MYGRGAAAIAEQIGGTKADAQKIVDDFYASFPSVKVWMDASLEALKEKGYVEDFYGRRRRLPDINIPAYSVVNSKVKPGLENFNPFLICEDREVCDPLVKEWEARVQQEVKNSQMYQKARAEKNGTTFVETDEMSNKAYEKLAKEAATKGIQINAFTGRRSQAGRQCVNAMIQGGAATMTKIAMNRIFRDPVLNQYGFKMLIGVHDELIGQCKEVYADVCAERLCEVMKTCVSDIVSVPFKCDPSVEHAWGDENFGYSIQEELTSLCATGLTEPEALEQLRVKHAELTEDKLQELLHI